MLQGMDQSEFGQFVAALWERQGWKTQVKRDDGRMFVAVQRPETDEEGLIWAIPDEGEVGGKQVQQFRSLCDEYGVREVAIVTAGTLSDHAKKVAEGTGVELLDGEGVAEVLKRKDLTGLVSQYGGNGGGGGSDGSGASKAGAGGGGGDDGSPVDRARELAGSVASPAAAKLAIVAVIVIALLATGVLIGPSIPFLGGGDGPVSAESVSPENSTASFHVAWNAKVTDTIDPNESDGMAYYAPEGKEFVIVRMSVNNTGNASAELRQSAFKLRTEDRTYGYQLLADHDGFLDFPISSGQHYVGWTVFTVPEGTTGTLVYDQNATPGTVAVEFERDSNFPVNVTQQ